MNASLKPIDAFGPRHIGPSAHQIQELLEAIGRSSLEDLCDHAVPEGIRCRGALDAACGEALTETEALARLRAMIGENEVLESFIGMGHTARTRRPSSSETSLKTQGGIRNTRPIGRDQPGAS